MMQTGIGYFLEPPCVLGMPEMQVFFFLQPILSDGIFPSRHDHIAFG